MIKGENNSAAYATTLDRCLDFFSDVVPGSTRESVITGLEGAWEEDPDTALRLIFNLGAVRSGKKDRTNFYRSLLWLYRNHPETFLANVRVIPESQCFKGLLDMLVYACYSDEKDGDELEQMVHHETEKRERGPRQHHRSRPELLGAFVKEKMPDASPAMVTLFKQTCHAWTPEKKKEYSQWAEMRDAERGKEGKRLRKEKEARQRQKAAERLASDDVYRRFFDEVADIFAGGLKVGVELAVKWAPTARGFHDKLTSISDGLIRKLFPEAEFKTPGGTDENYLSFMRDKYRKEYLTPLRKKAEIPEHFAGTGEWQLVNFKRFASVCRQKFETVYATRAPENHQSYIEEVRAGAVKGPAAGAVTPHSIIKAARRAGRKDTESVTANLQWKSLVQDVKRKGKLSNTLAICDVSGSMTGLPMDVAVALSMLVADVNEGAFRHTVCTFSESPVLVSIPQHDPVNENLSEREEAILDTEWGGSTDFVKVFKLLLKDPSKPVPDKLFVFSDMEFDQACKGEWETDYERIQKMFADAARVLPKIVFWNLRSSQSKPVTNTTRGVALLSGFSQGLLKAFLEQTDVPSPQQVMWNILYGDCLYNKLKVADCDRKDPRSPKKTKTKKKRGAHCNVRHSKSPRLGL